MHSRSVTVSMAHRLLPNRLWTTVTSDAMLTPATKRSLEPSQYVARGGLIDREGIADTHATEAPKSPHGHWRLFELALIHTLR